MAPLRTTLIPRALHRPNVILGGEREPVLMAAILCGGLAFAALNPVAIAIGGSVWVAALFGLRLMTKADPCLSKIYLRYLRYPAFFPARSRPSRGD